MDEETDIPPELLEPPSGVFPNPPVETAAQTLPFGDLTPPDFERLCMRLARLEGTPTRTRRYGTPGQKQYGIDIYSRLPSKRYATYQCRRYESVVASDIRSAVDDFVGERWAARSERFVLCFGASTDRTELEEEIEAQTDRLAAHRPAIALEVWDVEELSLHLRDHRDIVELFFGQPWARRFFGSDDISDLRADDLSNVIQAAVAEGNALQVVSNDWAPITLRPRLDELRTDDPESFRRLSEQFGNPPRAGLLAAAAAEPPPWLRDADSRTWELLARIAQVLGEWEAEARAWEHVGQMRAGYEAAGALIRAAIAAEQSGDTTGHERLLAEAEQINPSHPRLRLARWDDGLPADEQVAILSTLHSDDPEDLGLIAAQRTLALIMLPDTDGAREALAEVRRHIPGSLLADGLEISITVQEGRLAVLEHRALDRGALQDAATKAGEVRKRLLSARRYEEATRLLMLRADISALLEDRSAASATLRTATPEERASQEQKEVLASAAANRALDFKLALEFLDGASETPITLRLRLECLEETGTPPERQEALDGLDQMIAEGGPEAPEAAFVRLAATLGRRPTAWSDEAAVLLRSSGHERAAVSAEALYRVRHEKWAAVDELLRPYGNTPWALAARLRASLAPDVERSHAVSAARDVLAVGPSHSVRVEAARGLARGREVVAAREVLMAVARDPNAPDAARGDAYDLLIRIVGSEMNEWELAGELHGEWMRLRPGDTRGPAWAPMIANRRRRNRD
jgi:hypothetical protein